MGILEDVAKITELKESLLYEADNAAQPQDRYAAAAAAANVIQSIATIMSTDYYKNELRHVKFAKTTRRERWEPKI